MRRQNKFLFILSVLCFFVASCKKEIPSYVIQPKEMEDILYDYHLAQAVGDEWAGTERYKSELVIEYVFKKHNITQAEFDTSMVWYTRNMEKLSDIYTNLSKRFEDANNNIAQVYQSYKREKTASGDSINLWYDRKLYILSSSPLTNRVTFEMKADTTFHELDRLVWNMNVFREANKKGNLYASLIVSYKNDSVASVIRPLNTSGPHSIMLKTDTVPMKNLQGFIYYDDSIVTSIVVSDISLMRYHASSIEIKKLRNVRMRDSIRFDSLNRLKTDSMKLAKPERKDTVKADSNNVRLTPEQLRRNQRRR